MILLTKLNKRNFMSVLKAERKKTISVGVTEGDTPVFAFVPENDSILAQPGENAEDALNKLKLAYPSYFENSEIIIQYYPDLPMGIDISG